MRAITRCALLRGARYYEVRAITRCALLRGARYYEVRAITRCALLRGARYYEVRAITRCALLRGARYYEVRAITRCALLRGARYYEVRAITRCVCVCVCCVLCVCVVCVCVCCVVLCCVVLCCVVLCCVVLCCVVLCCVVLCVLSCYLSSVVEICCVKCLCVCCLVTWDNKYHSHKKEIVRMRTIGYCLRFWVGPKLHRFQDGVMFALFIVWSSLCLMKIVPLHEDIRELVFSKFHCRITSLTNRNLINIITKKSTSRRTIQETNCWLQFIYLWASFFARTNLELPFSKSVERWCIT